MQPIPCVVSPIRSMKRFKVILLLLLLALPLLLAACGGDANENAENFLKAMSDNDKDKAKEAACDDFSNEIDFLLEDSSAGDELGSISCEEDGDDVRCTLRDDEGDRHEIVLAIEDDKVCGIKSWSIEGDDIGLSISSDDADN